ncbi:MSMEG_6728 family protein [Microbacterium sp. CFH 31415]|uniref:MSMEG_6728 family protein n=1 Tax=Microbacterium sp. CFH 31415 TaxID=2921732 RepID=UPI001F13A01D|nr:MSMEG_6728 family protein [Microbacterium sp. CFH 31415]MCH6229303.1 MSMEG_6728 family protein [Microbacterium sp. CFH 31415]
MQTFLPYPSFGDSAAALDPARLGKQRVETLQLLRANTVPGYGWRHHPAAKMWAGRLPALVAYGLAMTDAWTALGRADSVRAQLLEFAPEVDGVPQSDIEMPRWLGDEAFHLSHRSNLVRKDPEFYRPRFGDVPDDLPYIWPTP